MSIKFITFLNIILILYFFLELESSSININSSWIIYNKNIELFPIQNIPFGICKLKFEENKIFCCTRISNKIIDLSILEYNNLLDSNNFRFDKNKNDKIFNKKNLNSFIELGRKTWISIRNSIQKIFSDKNFEKNEHVISSIFNIENIEMLLPVQIWDYTDFYSSRNHAFNMGSIIRGSENALQPNWVHLPVAYHGIFIY
jgi:fumarylacetoacetase